MYYKIRLDWDPKVIGVKNGVYQVELDMKRYDKMQFAKLQTFFIGGELSTEQVYPDLDYKFNFKKLKSAKETSFMRFTPFLNNCHFLVDINTLELFEKFNIQKYKAYEALIYNSSSENLNNNYRLFYSVIQGWNIIDFEKTVFTSGGFGNYPVSEHKFKDENEMRNFKGITNVKLLALTKEFDISLDFFHTRLGGLFVSEKLKSELERNNVTGIKFSNDVQVLINL